LSNQKNPTTKQAKKPPIASTFDEHLYELKMSEPTRRIKSVLVDGYFVLSAVGGSDSSYFSERSREFLEAADRCCRETLYADGRAVTPEFIEKELVPHVLAAFDFLQESIRRDLSAPTWSDAGRLLSEARLGELRKAICSKYEIEFIELKKRRALIPEIAQPLRSALDAPALQPEPTRKVRSPTTHEKKIWQVSQRGLEGDQYLRELHTAGARPRQSWIQRGCPGTYAGIAAERDPKWLQRAADEKSKVCKKLELLSH